MTYAIHPDDLAAEMATEADSIRERFAGSEAELPGYDYEAEMRLDTVLELGDKFERLIPLLGDDELNKLYAWADAQLDSHQESETPPPPPVVIRPGAGIRQNAEDTHLALFKCRQCEQERFDDGIDDGGPGWICFDCTVKNRMRKDVN